MSGAAAIVVLAAKGGEAGPSLPSVEMFGSKPRNPRAGALVTGRKFGVASLPVSVGCPPATTVGRVRVSSMVGVTPWKHLTPHPQKSWQGTAKLSNVPLRSGLDGRHLCPPGKKGTVTRSLPYELEWECTGGGRRKQKSLQMELRCDQLEKQTAVKPVRFLHQCPPGYVIKGTNKKSVELTVGFNNPRICKRKP